ncbi:glycosyltransferase family 4 protein [Bacillaceae bacterium]
MGTTAIVVVAPETLPVPPVKGGAVQTVIFELGRRLQGYKQTILAPDDGQLPGKERIGDLEIQRLAFVRRMKRKQKETERNDYLKKVQNQLSRLKPALVHIHNRPQFVLGIRRTIPQAKLILHLHNDHLSALPAEKQEEVVKGCHRIVCVSEYLAKKVQKAHKSFQHKIEVVRNGIDTERFFPVKGDGAKRKLRRSYGFSPDDVLLLYVGRIVPQKGLHKVLQAFRQLELRKRRNVKLLVVGTSAFGSEEQSAYERYVKKMSEKLKDRIVFAGYVPHDGLPDCYRLADLFVAPMRWNEPFGLVIGEAAASGLPIISSRRGAIPEMVKDRQTGLLLPAKFTSRELAQKIAFLLDHPSVRKRLGKAARERIKKTFRWESASGKLKMIYKKVLGE